MNKEKIFHTDRFTKGGQVFAHEWRMRFQNLRLVVIFSFLFFIAGAYYALKRSSVSHHDLVDFYLFTYMPTKFKVAVWPCVQGFIKLLESFLNAFFPWKISLPLTHSKVESFKTVFFDSNGRRVAMKSISFLQNTWVLIKAQKVFYVFKTGFISWVIGLILIWQYLSRKSSRLEDEKILDGSPIASISKAREIIKKEGASDLQIAPTLPLFKSAECSHIMILGSTGSGKTNCINGFLNQVRRQKKRALILDTNGIYVDRFFDESLGDIILNPFDDRSVIWDLWEDAKTPQDFDAFAEALIPEPRGSSNPVWHKNAREIISVTAEKLKHDPERSLQKLVDYAGWKPIASIRNFYVGTPVESLMCGTGRAEETVHSVRMQMTDSLKRLSMLPQSEDVGFSLKKYIKNPNNQGWLFISSKVSDRSSLSPLLRFWIATAMQAVLERLPYNDDSIFFVLDELFSLEGGTVPQLKTFLNEARKYQACAVLGLQDLSGVQEIYGHEALRSIFTNCATKAVFSTRDPQSAQYISQSMGEIEVLEASESLSMGSHHMRDGVNMGMQRRRKPIVSRDDIMSLANLEAFISMPKNLITKAKYPYYN